jgi:hypothetical protein
MLTGETEAIAGPLGSNTCDPDRECQAINSWEACYVAVGHGVGPARPNALASSNWGQYAPGGCFLMEGPQRLFNTDLTGGGKHKDMAKVCECETTTTTTTTTTKAYLPIKIDTHSFVNPTVHDEDGTIVESGGDRNARRRRAPPPPTGPYSCFFLKSEEVLNFIPTFLKPKGQKGAYDGPKAVIEFKVCRGSGYGTSFSAAVNVKPSPWTIEGGIQWPWGKFPLEPDYAHAYLRLCFKYVLRPFTPDLKIPGKSGGTVEFEVRANFCMTGRLNKDFMFEIGAGLAVVARVGQTKVMGKGDATGRFSFFNFDLFKFDWDGWDFYVRFDIGLTYDSGMGPGTTLATMRGNIFHDGTWHWTTTYVPLEDAKQVAEVAAQAAGGAVNPRKTVWNHLKDQVPDEAHHILGYLR